MPYGPAARIQTQRPSGSSGTGTCMPETAHSVERSMALYIKDSSGNNMMNGSEQFLPDYLSLYGLEITDGSTTTFRVTANGKVYINGNVTMSAGSSINWGECDGGEREPE